MVVESNPSTEVLTLNVATSDSMPITNIWYISSSFESMTCYCILVDARKVSSPFIG